MTELFSLSYFLEMKTSDLPVLSDFLESEVSYLYEGSCSVNSKMLSLPRTQLVERVAKGLQQELAETLEDCEGKMFGVLVVSTEEGKLGVLKAFSGLLEGSAEREGWVPPIPGRKLVALEEAHTLEELARMKKELIHLAGLTIYEELREFQAEQEKERKALAAEHRRSKKIRKKKREAFQESLEGAELEAALESLAEESRSQSYQLRGLRKAHQEAIEPLKTKVEEAEERIAFLRRERKSISRALQAKMHEAYSLTNFSGEKSSLQDLMPEGLPTGTGDCCAPKLLHHAAIHRLHPVGMAEFWWGASPPNESKEHGVFYGACKERCQPIMGFLLSGMVYFDDRPMPGFGELTLPILYQDDSIFIVDKPSELLSVPGRFWNRQDSVASRIQNLFPDVTGSVVVHRLDLATSGLLVLARHPESHSFLSKQFRERKVNKVYEAVLDGRVEQDSGIIKLPLGPDPERSPRQMVDFDKGKPCETHFRVMERTERRTRIQLHPITGRTHQLRLHCSHPEGLNAPILGDRFYGSTKEADRLHLHARELSFMHPKKKEEVHFRCKVPF